MCGAMQAGHAIHEDEPARTAQALLSFLQRFRIGEAKLPIPRPAGAGVVLPVAAGPACAARRHATPAAAPQPP